MLAEENRDLRPPFIALCIALAIVFVLYIDSVYEMHWLVSALLTGLVAGGLAKVIEVIPFFRRESSKTFDRIFLLGIFIFIVISFAIIGL
ncbi:hypothetical protein [Paenisporosarcina quisquiliarum]|uniref:hypothetical protein n=1 Tax=Paenisporosarcina quisquiliarum TaxID=365346 RepID=UPI00373675C1